LNHTASETEARLRETNWSSKNGVFADGSVGNPPKGNKVLISKTHSLGYRRIKWQKTWHEKGKSLGVHETQNVAA